MSPSWVTIGSVMNRVCRDVLPRGLNVLPVCKPSSHSIVEAWADFLHRRGGLRTRGVRAGTDDSARQFHRPVFVQDVLDVMPNAVYPPRIFSGFRVR